VTKSPQSAAFEYGSEPVDDRVLPSLRYLMPLV
jgi:hypothetical protein